MSEHRSGEDEPVVIRDKRKFDTDGNLRVPDPASAGSGGQQVGDTHLRMSGGHTHPHDSGHGGDTAPASDPVVTELTTQLADRTSDLQRVSAEYANYRKRVDRDREAMAELTRAKVLSELLPVLDDIDRAAQHGDLTGAFEAVAQKLVQAVSKQGLSPFGDQGDPFDPEIHEAVMHSESDEVSVPTATTIMRRGYRLNERLVRPAMVGVTDPSGPTEANNPTNDDAN